LTVSRGQVILLVVRLRPQVLPLVLFAIAAKLVHLGITRDGVGRNTELRTPRLDAARAIQREGALLAAR
jgi:hypothetical protein